MKTELKTQKMKQLIVSVMASTLLATSSVAYADNSETAYVNEARGLVKQFGGQLKPELKKAMKAGGPVNAVEVCHQKAPAIAEAISQKTGWQVSRVSSKARNENAQPDQWENSVLQRFEEQKSKGVPVKALEFAEIVHDESGAEFRYMKAIGTAEICLNCHGTNVADTTKQAIASYYPKDQAVGFNKGDIRGAFSFSKKVK